ncbi:MAG: hypothetical protein ACOY40_09985 [Bacillota bacterium]
MSCLLEMAGWITYNGPTQDNWSLLWYRDRVVARYMGENFTDFILRNDPIMPGGLGKPGETRLHPKSFSIDLSGVARVTFIRRRPFLLPQLVFEGQGKKISFYTRDKGAGPVEKFKKLQEIMAGGIELMIK